MRIGPRELIIVLIIVLVIFGPKNLPKLGKMFGKTMNNFKKGMEERRCQACRDQDRGKG